MIGKIVNFLSGGLANKAATVGINVAAILALAPLGYWFVLHKDETFTCVTWGQTAIVGVIIFVLLKIAEYTRPPKSGTDGSYNQGYRQGGP